MSSIKDVVRYFVKHYPYSEELSKTRLTKLVFLADWFSAQEHGRQVTDIRWYFDHYGPYVPDVMEEARRDRALRVRETVSGFGATKEMVEPRQDKESLDPHLTDDERKVLDRVIEETKNLGWTGFIAMVYRQYPIATQQRYTYLNLAKLAQEEFFAELPF